jgi:hypothetical protein
MEATFMNRTHVARSAATLLLAAAPLALLLLGCPNKNKPEVVDAAPPPPPPVEAAVVDLTPVVEDAGPDVVEAAAPKWTGPAVNPNTVKIRQCCNAIRAEAKKLGNSPEAVQLNTAAASCDQVAAQAGASGNAPELAAVKSLLGGRPLPALCAGL